MKKLLLTILVSLMWCNTAFAESTLPPCQGDDDMKWTNCFGTYLKKDFKKNGLSKDYTGEFGSKPGKREGKGSSKIYKEGSLIATFNGEFKDDEADGQGTLTTSKGDKFVGEYKDGKRDGKGTYTFASGESYEGEWKDNKFHGQGTKKYKYGDKYIGEWKDGKQHGLGTFVEYPSGNKYVGQWRDDKRHGQGTFTSSDGKKYIGEWKNDYEHGQGTTIYANGIKHVGVWDDGSETSEGTFTFTDGTTYTGYGADYIEKQYEKLSNKDSSLNAKEIVELCKEYRVKDISGGNYDNYTYNVYRGNTDYCRTIIIKSEFKIDAKNNLVKELDIGKIKFNLISNEDYSVTLSESEITKSSTCHIDIENESNLTYLEIYKRCGVEIKDNDFATRNWISILDYFYADANNDDYMDLIIRFKDDGSYSMRPMTMTAVITSLSKGKFININYD